MSLPGFASPAIDTVQSTVTCPSAPLYNVTDKGISEHDMYIGSIVHVAVFPATLAGPYIDEAVMYDGLMPLVVFHVAVTVTALLAASAHIALFIALENMMFDPVFALYTALDHDAKYISTCVGRVQDPSSRFA